MKNIRVFSFFIKNKKVFNVMSIAIPNVLRKPFAAAATVAVMATPAFAESQFYVMFGEGGYSFDVDGARTTRVPSEGRYMSNNPFEGTYRVTSPTLGYRFEGDNDALHPFFSAEGHLFSGEVSSFLINREEIGGYVFDGFGLDRSAANGVDLKVLGGFEAEASHGDWTFGAEIGFGLHAQHWNTANDMSLNGTCVNPLAQASVTAEYGITSALSLMARFSASNSSPCVFSGGGEISDSGKNRFKTTTSVGFMYRF